MHSNETVLVKQNTQKNILKLFFYNLKHDALGIPRILDVMRFFLPKYNIKKKLFLNFDDCFLPLMKQIIKLRKEKKCIFKSHK